MIGWQIPIPIGTHLKHGHKDAHSKMDSKMELLVTVAVVSVLSQPFRQSVDILALIASIYSPADCRFG